jgi:predicted transcriptional regulator
MSLHNISIVGLRSLSQVPLIHTLTFQRDQNGMSVSQELLTSPIAGAPVVDDEGHFIGFISEFDVLSAFESGQDIRQLTAEEIMVQDRIAIQESTSLVDAVRLMKKHHILVLPVERNGVVVGSVTRQDLLRAWMTQGLGEEVLAQSAL